jgi:hypothetical protein
MIDRMMLRHLVRIGDACGFGMRRTRVRILGCGDRGQERGQDKSARRFMVSLLPLDQRSAESMRALLVRFP